MQRISCGVYESESKQATDIQRFSSIFVICTSWPLHKRFLFLGHEFVEIKRDSDISTHVLLFHEFRAIRSSKGNGNLNNPSKERRMSHGTVHR